MRYIPEGSGIRSVHIIFFPLEDPIVRKLCNGRRLTLKFTEFEYKILEAYFYLVGPQFPWNICENNFPVLSLNHHPMFSKNCVTSLSGENKTPVGVHLSWNSLLLLDHLLSGELWSALQHAEGTEDCGHPLCQPPGGAKQCLIH